MKWGADRYAVLAVVLLAVLFVGEACTYAPVHQYDSSAEWGEGQVDFTVSSSGSDAYSAVLMDRNGSVAVETLYIFVDENYQVHFSEADSMADIDYVDQEYNADQIRKALGHRGFDSVEICDSSRIAEVVSSTAGDPAGKGILVSSYALPSSIYTGDPADPIMKWINAGGTLYWLGSEIGRFSSDSGSLKEVDGNQVLFFGRECVNTGDTKVGLDYADTPFTDAFSLKNSSLVNALDATGLENGLEMGFVSDGYASIAMVSVGKGAVCVFGGPPDIKLVDDIGQVIAAGITPTTEVVEVVESQVTRGTESGTIRFDADSPSLYIYIGGTYTKYGGSYGV